MSDISKQPAPVFLPHKKLTANKILSEKLKVPNKTLTAISFYNIIKNMKKGFLKKVISGLTVCSIGVGALTICLCSKITEKDLLGNQQYQQEVISQLDADMQIMQLYNYVDNVASTNQIVRLKPNDNKKVYIKIDDIVSDRAKSNIRKTLSEMNTAFSYINDSYVFEECSSEKFSSYRSSGDSTISFSYTKLDSSTFGLTTNTSRKSSKFGLGQVKGGYIQNSTIYFDYQVFDQLSDDSQLFVIKHEFLHALGFSDIYDTYDDETSLMNVGLAGLSTHVSPNDLKMLYVAYGNKHINKDGTFNQEKMDEVKQLISKYETKYYEYLMSNLKKEFSKAYQPISKSEVENQTFTKDGATITINQDTFTYTKDGVTQQGHLVVGSDYIILPDIQALSPYDKSTTYNDFLVLLKRNDVIDCYNIDIYHSSSSQNVDPLVQGLDIWVR